jgi:release factor glutamine methyltransferase
MFSLDYQIKILTAKELGLDLLSVVLNQHQIPDDKKKVLEAKISKLKSGIPLDYLLGEIKILGLKLAVTSDTLIPREETEDWIEKYKSLIVESERYDTTTVVDLGSGSGLIGLSLAEIYENVWLVDISPKALKVAKQNAKTNNITNAKFVLSDGLGDSFCEKISKLKNPKWHLVANLPYLPVSDLSMQTENRVEHEPAIALYSGNDGLDLFRKVVAQIDQMIFRPEIAIWELDPRNIHEAKEYLEQIGYVANIWKDKNGQDRVLASVIGE